MLEGNLSKVKIIVQQINLNTYLSNATELNIFLQKSSDFLSKITKQYETFHFTSMRNV